MVEKWGKLFFCPVCHSQANADHNASVNTHHAFYHEMYWQWREKKRVNPAPPAMPGHPDKDWQARPVPPGTPRPSFTVLSSKLLKFYQSRQTHRR
jgi:hypothetical protein